MSTADTAIASSTATPREHSTTEPMNEKPVRARRLPWYLNTRTLTSHLCKSNYRGLTHGPLS
jgi:hypothetical protein